MDCAPVWSLPWRCFLTAHWCLNRWAHSAEKSRDFNMTDENTLRIGIACFPTVGGSGVLASALGEELARRGHEVHFFSYERPFRLPLDAPRLHFHRVEVNDYR